MDRLYHLAKSYSNDLEWEMIEASTNGPRFKSNFENMGLMGLRGTIARTQLRDVLVQQTFKLGSYSDRDNQVKVIKAANASEGFTPKKATIISPVATKLKSTQRNLKPKKKKTVMFCP